MRVGQNPAKFVEGVAQPAKITAAVVTYIPFIGGYYAESLDVLKLCLESLRAHADMEFDLLVFDNASCPEAREFLLTSQRDGNIQYLILSEQNVGKAGAWNVIFGAAPGEYVAYADSDVYFFPDWLSPQIEVLETFPNAGMVTGMPLLTPAEYSTATLAWVERQQGVQLDRGRFISWEDFWRHAGSLGDEPKARAFYEANESARLSYSGKSYYVGAGHFQFVARKPVLQSVLPLPSNRPMGEVRVLDEKINAQGLLRLCTPEWHIQHVGNSVPREGALEEAVRHFKPIRRSRRYSRRVAGPFRKLLQWVYNRAFEMLYRS